MRVFRRERVLRTVERSPAAVRPAAPLEPSGEAEPLAQKRCNHSTMDKEAQ